METRAEAITRSFYQWEIRGRGWATAPYPVALEPPFRPCLLIPNGEEVAPDSEDGRIHTPGSRLVRSIGSLFRAPRPENNPPPFEEQPPFPDTERGQLETLAIAVPGDAAYRPAFAEALLSVLGTALSPVSFEVIGRDGVVSIQLTLARDDAPAIRAHLEAFDPTLIVEKRDDRLREMQDDGERTVVSFGLADECFLPLPALGDLAVDPLVPLVSALSAAGRGELLALQVLFTPTRNPWPAAIRDALDDGDGGCLFEDAPWFQKSAEEKTETAIMAAVVRVAVRAETEERVSMLLRGMHGYLAQFSSAQGNSLVPLPPIDDVDEWECVLDRTSCRTGMLLSTRELAAFVHLPGEEVRGTALQRPVPNEVPLPDAARGRAVVLGTHRYRGTDTPVTIDEESRFAHTWVIGGSGTGKSTFLAARILADIEHGHGLAVLDPHGDLIDDVLARMPAERRGDVILFDPADNERPVPLTVLHAQTELEAELIASDLVGIFRRFATSWGDSMSTVLGEAVVALLRRPGGASLRDLKRFLADDRARDTMLKEVGDPEVTHFWTTEYPRIGSRSIGPLLSRLDAFLRTRTMRHVLGARTSPFSVGDALRGGKIILARLAKGQIGEENAYLLGSLLLSKLTMAAHMRQAVPRTERRPFFIYADECQHFVTPSLTSLLTEGRKYRVGLVLAHQTLAQLGRETGIESALLGNAHTRIVFRPGDADAAALAKGFGHFDADALLGLRRGEVLVRIGDSGSDFLMRTGALSSASAMDTQAAIDAVREASRARYGVAVEPEAIAVPAPAPIATDVPTPQRVRPRPLPVSKEPPLPGRGGPMHKYLQHLVKRLAEERGFRATIEGTAAHGRADVVLVRDAFTIACEISVTTDAAHEIENLAKCRAHGFTHVLAISPERRIREALLAAATDAGPGVVQAIAPEEIVTALDAFGVPEPTETSVRGYKVRVTRTKMSSDDVGRRSVLGAVLARSAQGLTRGT